MTEVENFNLLKALFGPDGAFNITRDNNELVQLAEVRFDVIICPLLPVQDFRVRVPGSGFRGRGFRVGVSA